MHRATEHTTGSSEMSILARVLSCDEQGRLSSTLARHFLTLGFSGRDKDRMHDLAAKARAGTLTPDEQAEGEAYSRIGSLLGILKSKARRSLKGNEPRS